MANLNFQDWMRQYCKVRSQAIPKMPRNTEEQRQLVRSELFLIKLMTSLMTCDARTREGGLCRRRPAKGKKRCALHGGKSTGPSSEAGKQRIAEASRQRMITYWENKRAEKDE